MDLSDSITPRSDQINADDLMSGPRTVTITDVTQGTDEQPVNIVTAQFGPGRPYKPSKSMRRIMVAAWGRDSSAYIGQRLTIYRDPDVKFGKEAVGGIKISAMSGIGKPLTVALTVTRGKRSPHVVEPITGTPAAGSTLQHLTAALDAAAIPQADRLPYCIEVVGRELKSARDLRPDEIAAIIDTLGADQ